MTRLISGVVLAVAALAAILFLPFLALRLLACVVAMFAAHEYVRIAAADDSGVAGALIACWAVSSGDIQALSAIPVLVILLAVLMVLWRDVSIQRATAAAFATLYIGVPLGMLAALHAGSGWRATVFLIGAIVVSDSAQYYTGRAFGRRPLAPAISPKKTVEGAIGGVVFGTLFIVLVGRIVFGFSALFLVPFGIVVVMLGIAGDLFESRLKRAAGVKDSSDLIPGHGGVLDRIDALLFAAPAFYVYFKGVA
jgi:phosphatidate cytidylyltransferase